MLCFLSNEAGGSHSFEVELHENVRLNGKDTLPLQDRNSAMLVLRRQNESESEKKVALTEAN